MISNFLSESDAQILASLPRLLEIFKRHLPTKQSHNYLPVYERFFEPYRLKSKKILEIGVEAGTSLRMWRDYFPNAEIYGFDIDPSCKSNESERIHIITGDQTSKADMESLPNDFDIIIDDGLHSPASQIASFEYLFLNKMKQTGLYVVEDVIASNNDYRTLNYFAKLSSLLNYWPSSIPSSQWSSLNSFEEYLKSDHISSSDQQLLLNTIGVSFNRHIIFVDKGKNPTDGQAFFRLNCPELQLAVNKTRDSFLSNSEFVTTLNRYKKAGYVRYLLPLVRRLKSYYGRFNRLF